MGEFAIRRVDSAHSQSVEQLGSKPKFWFRDGTRRLLFKADNRGTGEDWAEVVSCHLCRLLGLPHVEYELAAEYQGASYFRPGVVCANMARKPLVLVLGNQLLLTTDPSYPKEKAFRVSQHTVEAVSDVVLILEPPRTEWMKNIPEGVNSALDVFVGYVMLDAWIANQDRHHENWGSLAAKTAYQLAPTFDHGAALARNLTDEEREERLTTKDRNRTVATFAAKGRSSFYASSTDQRALGLREAFLAFAEKAPEARKAWLDRLRAVCREDIEAIIARVPAVRMSETSKLFTLELLLINQRRLLE